MAGPETGSVVLRNVGNEPTEGFTGAKFDRQKQTLQADQEQYREMAQRTHDTYKRFLMTYAQDSSLSYKIGWGTGFYTNLETGEVNEDAKWYAEQGYTPLQILWAKCHEIEHFQDVKNDPEGMKKNIDYVKAQARKTGAVIMGKWEEAFAATDPEFVDSLRKQNPINKKQPPETMNAVEKAAHQIHHTFYNIWDDIHGNNRISRRAPVFESGQGAQEVKRLYKEKLFPNREDPTKPPDFSGHPRHMQYIFALIREEMVPDEKVIVSPDVQDALDRKIQFQGQEYTAKEILQNFIRPRSNRDTRPSLRNLVLQRTVEPIFIELLMKDIADWKPEKVQPPPPGDGESSDDQSGAANPFAAPYQDYQRNNPDQHSDDNDESQIDKFVERKKREDQEADRTSQERNKSTEQKAAESQETLDRNWCQKNDIKYETLKKYRQVEKEIEPYLDDLSRLWRRIVFGSTRQLDRQVEGYYKEGTELSISETISEWPKIESGQLHDVKNMKKTIISEILIKKPDLIRVRVTGDTSTSMNPERLRILQQVFVLVFSSLKEFKTHLNLSRKRTKSKLTTDTEGWIFGTVAKKVKPLNPDSQFEDDQVEIIKAFEDLQKTAGGTNDHLPLIEIRKELTPADMKAIGEEKIMDILFHITDGGSQNPVEARKAVDNLLAVGMIPRAFQIGTVDEKEKRLFNQVWNDDREEKLGQSLGTEIGNVLPSMTELLKAFLGNVRL